MLDLHCAARGVSELRALPGTASRLTSILSREDWRLEDIVTIVQHDPVLAGRLFQQANSPALGWKDAVATTGEAVMRLGTGPVLMLAVGAAVREALERRLSAFGVDEGVLWRHSVAAALAVSNAGAFCAPKPPPEAFVAALVHDVGFLLLDRWLTSLPLGSERAAARATIEGEDHAALAGLVATRWSLPETVQAALASHHRPERCEDERTRLVASFVNLADCVARTIGAGLGPEQNRLDRETALRLELDRAGFEALCARTRALLDSFLGLYERAG